MSAGFVVGSIRQDAVVLGRSGWILGSFFPEVGDGSERRTGEIEVKYWEYLPGEASGHGAKSSATVEWSYILTGSTLAQLDGREVVLNAGDYVLIHPGTPNNLVSKVLEPISAITVKAPSDPSAKKAVS
jgi:mannose-6-phosphate isomerase-like protein (cupin superfamily)